MEKIAHYELLEQLGAGGMGVVYRANDLKLGRVVALKFLHGDMTANPQARERFIREARAASAVDHPNICTIHAVEEGPDGRLFIAMPLYDGDTLATRIARGALPPPEARKIASAVASGLAKAHRLGIVHRDVKPANVMITRDGVVKILDFGLARSSDLTAMTRAGTVLGSPAYMSPEQVQGDPADARSDIWSLGVVLYEMVTGSRPFRGNDDRAVFHAILDREPSFPPVDASRMALLSIANRCMRKNREDRYQTADAVLQELQTSDSSPTVARPPREEQSASIAVLPFADMSPQRDQDYFCEGVAEEILNSLTRVEKLRVASRTSSFQFKGASEDIRRIGERLGVRSVLEGSVRKAGDRLRVTVQLIDVANGYHLWSERYDRKLEDVFAIQDEIAESVASSLQLVIGGQEEDRRRAAKTDLEAYAFYLRGRQRMSEFVASAVREARSMFAKAVEIDPQYALGYTGMADASSWLVMWFAGDEDELRAADEASRRALELAPAIAEAHAARGLVLMLRQDHAEAEKHFKRAIELNPGSFEAHYAYGRDLFATGRYTEAETMMRRAADIRVDDYQSMGILNLIMRRLGRVDEAMTTERERLRRIERQLELNPRDARALYHGAFALFELGRVDEARAWIERSIALEPDDPAVFYNVACFYVRVGEYDRALDWLARVVASRAASAASLAWMKNDPDIDPLRALPRYKEMFGADA